MRIRKKASDWFGIPVYNVHEQETISRGQGGIESTIESDSHADTWCLGPNFVMSYYTGQVCDVSGFNNNVAESEVRVGTGFTCWVNPVDGTSQLIEVHQGLDMRDKIRHTLANPNQSRDFDVSWCDDAWDPNNRPFGIKVGNVFIPFELRGSTALFKTRQPTHDEIEHLYESRITLTSSMEWNPHDLQAPRRVSATTTSSRNSNLSAIAVMKNGVDRDGLRVCATMERDAGFIPYGNVDRLLAGISTALTDETLLPRMIHNVNVAETVSDTRHSDISPETLSRKWRISLDSAKETLQITTQQGIRQAIRPITRRYRTGIMNTDIRRLRATVYADTGFVNIKSLRQNTCYQGYSCENFVQIYPMRKQTDAAQSLHDFANDVGAPAVLITDDAPLLQGSQSKHATMARHLNISLRATEPGTQRQNKFELETRIFSRRWKGMMAELNVPKRLWDYALEHEAKILSMTARGADGIPGLEKLTGERTDITEYLDFGFWDRVWFQDDPGGSTPPTLGRWVGVAHRIGSALCYWVLKSNGEVEPRTTVQHVTTDDAAKPGVMESIEEYDRLLKERLKDDNFHITNDDVRLQDVYEEDRNDHDTERNYDDDMPEIADRDDIPDEAYEALLGAEVMLPNERADDYIRGTVLKRLKNNFGKPVGVGNDKVPALDTRQYVVRMDDGSERELQHNIIAQNIFAQCDSEGRRYLLLDEISDVRRNEHAIKKSDPNATTTSKNGNVHHKKTTKGWEFLCSFKDRTQDWVPLKDIMASSPLEVAEFAVARGIHDEPAFKWWVNHTLNTRKRIIDKVKTRYWKQQVKFGILLPKTVEEALRLDERNGNHYWRDAMGKENNTVKVAYKLFHDKDGNEITPGTLRHTPQKYLPGFKEITCHTIFDIKLDGKFTRKARFVANGSKVEWPKSMTYSSVVSRESVRIAFLVAALNGLEVSACDISGAYLNAPAGEKVWFVGPAEVGELKGCVLIVVRALYGLKSSAKAWRTFFSNSLAEMGYTSCRADPDVYMKKQCDKEGNKYWSYMLVYVDDCLLVHHDPGPTMDDLKRRYSLKNDAYGEPDRYLGANTDKFHLSDGHEYWSMHPYDYVDQVTKMVKQWSIDDNRAWKSKRKNAMSENYAPELDISRELDDDLATRYQQMIGILRWSIELGRIDIITEISHLSSFNCSPREGHLEAAYQVFEYLYSHKKGGRIVYDPSTPKVVEGAYCEVNWSEVYGDLKEQIPNNVPEERGLAVVITMFCDAAHAGNKVNRRSQTGILFFLQMAPIIWYSKKQETVEASTFGSELVALRIACEINDGLRYKLRMMGIPLTGPTNGYCDNQSVVHNASKVESTLGKKHLAVNYHLVRECYAKGAIRITWESTKTNLADVCTKIMSTFKKKDKMRCIVY